ncbi:MAG: rhomboid family intramembrane serine protease [Pseudomonadota bacterium]
MLILDSPVTLGLIIANVILSFAGFNSEAFIRRNLFIVGPILQGQQYHRLITSGFLHANGMHLFFNMITLFFFGPAMEYVLGSPGFAITYAAGLLGGGLWSLMEHNREPDYAALGASGAVAGVLVSYCLFAPFSMIFIYFIPVPAILFAVAFIAYSAVASTRDQGRIAHDAHLGGALAGALATIIQRPDAWSEFTSSIEQVLGLG